MPVKSMLNKILQYTYIIKLSCSFLCESRIQIQIHRHVQCALDCLQIKRHIPYISIFSVCKYIIYNMS